MIPSYPQHLVSRKVKKLVQIVAPVVLGVMLLLLLGFLLMPKAAAVPPSGRLLQPGNPVINPVSNTHTAPATTTVSITYDEAVNPATVSTRTFAVHAMQTGLLTQAYGVNGGTISLTPTRPLKPGELVQVSATTSTLNLSGQGPVSPTVWQFWTAAVKGGGIFTDGQDLSGSDATQDLALGDLDDDGGLDVLVANIGANTVWWNDGNGAFTDSGQRLGSADSRAVALGDLDGDGDLDAFVANDGANMVWWNDGGGTFNDSGQRLGNANSMAVALGDLNGDGDLDAFIGNDGQNDEVWFNDGTGHFNSSGQAIASFLSADVALGDLDGDNDLDAFVSTCCNQVDRVWLNNGNGLFTGGQVIPESASEAVALGDVDGDGDLDVFVGNFAGGNRVWLNNGDGTFADSGQGLGSSQTRDVALGDVDGDGDLDAFVGNANNQPNTIWLNDGVGIFANTQGLGNSNSWAVVLGDIDGDRDLDAIDGNHNQPNEVWSNVTPEVQINQIIPNPSYFGEIVEFNGSGTTDRITEILDEYEWTLLPVTQTCGAQPDPFLLGGSARLLINSLPVGEGRVCLRARHCYGVWSDYDTKTITVLAARGIHSDIAVSRDGISFWEDENATVPESNPSIGDRVYVKVRVDNISLQDTPDAVTVSIYDGDVMAETLIATDTIGFIAAGAAESLTIPWTVEGDEGYRVLSVDIEYTQNISYFAENPLPPWDEPHIESTYDNNQATAFIVVGSPIPGTYAISVTADIAPFIGVPALYAGYPANLFGEAYYNWGSQVPVMGAETSIEISGAGVYSDVYNTWTMAPFGQYMATVQLPPTPGIYTATVTVFDNNLIGATAMTFTVAPRPEPLPDLYVQRFSVGLSGRGVYQRDWHTYTPDRVYYHSGLFGVQNKPIVINARVVNGGDLNAGPFAVSFFDGSPYGGGVLLGTAPVGGLASGDWTTVNYVWTPTQIGTHAIQVVVDEANDIRESDEINNYDTYYYKYQAYFNSRVHRDIINIRAKNPDLRATHLIYEEPNDGEVVTMTTTVKNIGHYKVRYREGFDVTVYDGYPGISNTKMLTETRINGPVVPNDARTINNIVWNTEESGVDPGQHHICVVVDTGDEIDEELEENNTNCWDPYVYPLKVDLQPVGLSFSPKAPRPVTPVTITATIKNLGAYEFTRTEDISFYWGWGDSRPDAWIGSKTLEGPIAGRGGAGTTSITWTTPVTHGTAYIYVEVTGHLSDVRGLTIYPDPPPDLRIRSADIRINPPSPVRGEPVGVEVDITNAGVTTATNFIVRFHTDSPSQGLVPLGSPRVVSSLAPGETTTVQANATFAATDPYYAIKVEAIPAVGQWDADFGDNEATTSIAVSLPPDLTIFKDIFKQRLLSNYAYLDYILTIGNTWVVTATGPLTVTDKMPSGLNFENAEEGLVGCYDDNVPSHWRCSSQGLTLTCTYSGSLAPNASTQVHVWGLSWVDITPTDTITNCATVHSPYEDDPANNEGCHVIALGEITGTIIGPGDSRLAGIDVIAYRPEDGAWDYAGAATTDATGRYALTYLEVGTYKVEFYDRSNRYYSEYYDDVRDFETASPIDVFTGTTTVINASLEPIMMSTITGTMMATGGTGLEEIHAIAYPLNMNEQDDIAAMALHTSSGRVIDAETREPIPDAIVTLYKVPGWPPDDVWSEIDRVELSEIDPVELGVIARPVLEEFDPLDNPQIITESGYYSWDLDEGCWYVIAEARWYIPGVSPVRCVPPQVTGLDLALVPRRIYLPVIFKDYSD